MYAEKSPLSLLIPMFGLLLLVGAGFLLLMGGASSTPSNPDVVDELSYLGEELFASLEEALEAVNEAIAVDDLMEANRVVNWIRHNHPDVDVSEFVTGRVICAWCAADLGASNTVEDSHGICQLCTEKWLRKE